MRRPAVWFNPTPSPFHLNSTCLGRPNIDPPHDLQLRANFERKHCCDGERLHGSAENALRHARPSGRGGINAALVAVYHADHRELCVHEREYPFAIINLLEIVGASMGLSHEDRFKRFKKLQDVELIMAETQDLRSANAVNMDEARHAIRSMLDEQPLALRSATPP